jgi:outer membrane immunogenic protein
MKAVWTAAAVTILGVATASAADLPARVYTKAPPVVSPAYNWTGFYIGANVGALWSRSDVTVSVSDFFGPAGVGGPDGIATLNQNGSHRSTRATFQGGGQVGFNWQQGPWVLGVEGSINAINFKRTFDTGILPTPPLSPGLGTYRFADEHRSTWLATLGPRLGYASDRWLGYITGGAAFARVSFDTVSGPFAGCGGCSVATVHTTNRTGWFAGAGVEYAFAPNWSVKGEYLHADLGNVSHFDNLAAGGFPQASFVHNAKLTHDSLRFGINYKFGAMR